MLLSSSVDDVLRARGVLLFTITQGGNPIVFTREGGPVVAAAPAAAPAAPAKGKKKIHRRGRVTKLELQTELRHKYLTILKSLYWEYFEEGQCGPEAVVVLMEAADRALDHEETPLDDWGFINTYVLSNAFLSCIGSLAKIPFFGKVFRNLLFDHFSVSYDICVNFIEGHEEASKMLVNVI